MLDHVNVGHNNFVVLLELLELFRVVAAASTVAHDHSIFSIAINKVEHICTHALDLYAIYLQYFIGMVVLRRIRQLYYEVLTFLLVLQCGHAEDSMIVKEGHHAVSMIDNISFAVVCSKSDGTVWSL